VLLLVADGLLVVQGRVAALTVVEDLDEVEDRRAQPGSGGPGVAIQQVAFPRTSRPTTKITIYGCRTRSRLAPTERRGQR
jgi:hypothetical protein